MKPWTKKYQPHHTSSVVGQTEALATIHAKLGKKPLLFYGPPGTGKTSTAHAIGKEKNKEVFEINASDARNKAAIESKLGNALKQQSLFGRQKLILIDDIDALSGRKDRGGLATMISLFDKTPYPVILTCIDPWDDKFSKLRRKVTMIEFPPVKRDIIATHLQTICKKEQITFQEDDVNTLAKNAQGDLRAAVNDLQTHCANNTLQVEFTGKRNKEQSLDSCLRKVLKSKRWKETVGVFDKTNADLNECLLWLDENLPKEYKGEDLAEAYNHLSRADVFNGRIRRWQHWRFLVYVNLHLTAGVATAKKEASIETVRYTRTTRILKLWQAKVRNAKKLSIAAKIAEKTHTSKKQAAKDSFPFLKSLLRDKEIIQELELDEEEITWLEKKGY